MHACSHCPSGCGRDSTAIDPHHVGVCTASKPATNSPRMRPVHAMMLHCSRPNTHTLCSHQAWSCRALQRCEHRPDGYWRVSERRSMWPVVAQARLWKLAGRCWMRSRVHRQGRCRRTSFGGVSNIFALFEPFQNRFVEEPNNPPNFDDNIRQAIRYQSTHAAPTADTRDDV